LIFADGSYQIVNPPGGEVKVAIQVPPPDSDPAVAKKWPPPVIPARFTDPNTSGLKVTIAQGDNRCDIRLE
jgi:hypothetical protein